MSTDAMKRRLDRLRVVGGARPVVVTQLPGETLVQLRRRVRATHGDLGDRDLVIIERTGSVA